MTTWSNETKYAGQSSITYNESGKTYNEATYNYNGKVAPIWSSGSRNTTSYSNQSRNSTSFTNETKN